MRDKIASMLLTVLFFAGILAGVGFLIYSVATNDMSTEQRQILQDVDMQEERYPDFR